MKSLYLFYLCIIFRLTLYFIFGETRIIDSEISIKKAIEYYIYTTAPAENVEKILNLVQEDCCQTIHELTDTTGISYGVCQVMLTENLNMCRTAAKFVPQFLTNNQKQWRVNVCLELREKVNEDPTFISRIITGDKSRTCFPN
jgi:hypothetical protein